MKISPIEVSLMGHYGDDLLIVNAARVSFNKEHTEFIFGDKVGSDERLIHYLAKEGHWMPFAHPHLTFRIKAPLFVARQLGKHQIGFSWSEESRRYVKNPPEFFFPEYWRKQSNNVKQGSSEDRVVLSITPSIFDYEEGDLTETPIQLCQYALEHYTALLKQGVCAEQARMILPQNTMTNWVWTGSLMAFVRMLKLRLDSHTQKETQEVAKLIAPLIEKKFPVSYKALMEI